MNTIKAAILVMLLSTSHNIIAQEKLPVLKSNTQLLTIKEGNAVYKNIWRASAAIELDTFVTNHFEKQNKITFYSDIDSISFIVKPNMQYNFIVLLNGEKKAKTQINTNSNKTPTLKPKLFYTSNKHTANQNDTIHFSLEEDSRMYIKGTINGSDTLNFLFDTGAGANVIVEQVIRDGKVQVKADGSQDNAGSDGVNHINTSTANRIQINDLHWNNVPLLIIPYGKPKFDAVLSWRAFEDKIVEINYDKSIVVIHTAMPTLDVEYAAVEMNMLRGIPFVKCILSVNNKIAEGWFDFDTGSNGELSVSQKFASGQQLNGVMKQIGKGSTSGSSGVAHTIKVFSLPKFKLGNYELYNIPLDIYDKDPEGLESNEILGNNVLKRFNTIIDFKNERLYIKPNKWLYSKM